VIEEVDPAGTEFRYQQLIKRHQPRKAPPRPPGATGHPPSIDRPRATRPWQRYDQHNSG